MSKNPQAVSRKRDRKTGRWPQTYRVRMSMSAKQAIDAYGLAADKFCGADIVREVMEIVVKTDPKQFAKVLESLRKLEKKTETKVAAA